MVLDATGSVSDSLRLEDRASKGTSGRVVPMSSDLRSALGAWRTEQVPGGKYVVTTERSLRTSAQAIVNMFFRWYHDLGFVGCSSHSGRRTFITNAARKISTVGGSIRDVQGQIFSQHSIFGKQPARTSVRVVWLKLSGFNNERWSAISATRTDKLCSKSLSVIANYPSLKLSYEL
jgi:hypothetical protein